MINDIYQFESKDKPHGGFPRVVTLIEELRSPGDLVFVCGDFIGGSALSVASRGGAGCSVVEQCLRPDAVVIGNHEFDFGPERLIELMHAHSSLNWLASNVRDTRTGALLPGCKDSTILESNGLRIGVIGLCTAASQWTSFPGPNVEFQDVIEHARECEKSLRARGADVVIALTHLSLAEDRELAVAVPGISLLLGGHDHSPWALFERDTLIFKAGQNGYWVGIVTLTVSDNKVYFEYEMKSTLNLISNTVCVDVIKGLSTAYLSDQTLNEPVPDTPLVLLLAPLECRTVEVRSRGTSAGSLIADAMLYQFPGADIAFVNGGFIRGDTFYDTGTLFTSRHLEHELPFLREAVMVEILEYSIWNALEQHLCDTPDPLGSFINPSSGCVIEYNSKLPRMNKILSIHIEGHGYLSRNGKSSWKVVLTEFLRRGGDNCVSWKESALIEKQEHRILVSVRTYLEAMCDSAGDYSFKPPQEVRIRDTYK